MWQECVPWADVQRHSSRKKSHRMPESDEPSAHQPRSLASKQAGKQAGAQHQQAQRVNPKALHLKLMPALTPGGAQLGRGAGVKGPAEASSEDAVSQTAQALHLDSSRHAARAP